jgi:hypothetical protein
MLLIKNNNSKLVCLFCSCNKTTKSVFFCFLLFIHIKCISTVYLSIIKTLKVITSNRSNKSASNPTSQFYTQRICSRSYACASNSLRKTSASMLLPHRFSLQCGKQYKFESLSQLALSPVEVAQLVWCSLCDHSNNLFESPYEFVPLSVCIPFVFF